jgi:sugar phosphate permease
MSAPIQIRGRKSSAAAAAEGIPLARGFEESETGMGHQGGSAMLEIAALIGLFSWGINSDRLTFKHAGVILLLSCLFGGLGGLIARKGEAPIGLVMIFTIGFELVLQTIILLAGFGIGRYRAGKAGASNIEDTFG